MKKASFSRSLRLPARIVARLFVTIGLVVAGCGGSREARNGHFTLGNGMEVILVENHASPMVSSVVCVRAGSAYEDGTNNGVSHLLEHLLFDGTGERTRTGIMDGIENRGGYLNATTRDDHTAFILLIPSEHVDFGLDVQADMLFNSIFPDSELAKERKVVIEEINRDTDSPDDLAQKFHRSFLFQGTPFSRPVIGYRNIVASISREEILRYYRERYVPENMIAFVTGDFEPEAMLATLERIFGVVPPGKNPEPIQDVRLPRRPNRIFRLDADTDASRVSVSFDGPSPGDPDYYAFDLFVRILSGHDGSPLQAAFAGTAGPVGYSVSTDLSPHPGFSTLTVSFTTAPGREEEAVDALLGVLEEQSAREPDSAEVAGVRVDLESEEYFLRERYHYYGLMKAPFLVTAGFDFVDGYVERMRSVTPSEVRKVAETHFSRPEYVATVVGPSGGAPSVERPASGEVVERTVLANGLRLVVRPEPGSKVFAVHVLAGNRAYLEPDGRSGLADCLSRMLLRGTTTRDRATLAADLAAIGAKVTVVDNPWIPYDDYYTSRRYAFLRFEVLAEFWRPGLEILADILRRPAFDSEELEGVRGEMLAQIARRDQTTSGAARRLFFGTLFGDHPFSRPILGSEADVREFSVADLRWLHGVLFSPGNLVVAAVGGVPADSVRAALGSLFEDAPPVELPAGFPRAPERGGRMRNAEERLGKEQAYILMGDLLPGAGHEDVPAIRMMISILSERLAKDLREGEGLAYSIGASAHFARGFGWYTISMGTERSNYRRALDGIRKEIDRLRSERVGEEELHDAILRTRGRAQMKRLSSINRAYFLGLNEFLLDDFREGDLGLARLGEVESGDVRRVARAYLHGGAGALVSIR